MTAGSSRKARASGITRSAKIVKGKMLKEARGNLCQLMFLLIKKRVFVVQSMEDLPEVQRMQWLVQRSKQGDCPRKVLVASLLLDCAVRRPMFTRMLGSLLEECRADDDASDVMQMALEMRSDDWGSGMFWTGQAKANLETGLKKWTADELVSAGAAWGIAKDRAKSCKLIRAASSLPQVGKYLSHTMVRTVSSALGVRVLGGAQSAAEMSEHVSALHDLIDFRAARGELIRFGVQHARSWQWNLLSCLYCECGKVLRASGVMIATESYSNPLDLAEALLSPQMKQMLDSMQHARECEDWPSEEAAQVASTLKIDRPMFTLATVDRHSIAMAFRE